MTRLRYGTSCLIILAISTGILFAESNLETLKTKYEKLLAGIVKEHDSKMADLNDQYSKLLNELLKTVKQEGNEDKINAVTEELNYFEFGLLNKQDISSKAQEFPELHNLQVSYRKQVPDLAADKENRILGLVQQYDKALGQLEDTLADQGNAAEAHEVRREREKFRNTQEFKSAQNTIEERQKRQASTAKQPEVPKVSATTPPEQAGSAPSPVEQQAQMDITVRKGKKSTSVGWDDVGEQLNLSISIKNREVAKDFIGLKGLFFAFSEDVSGYRGYKLIIKEKFDFNLLRQDTYVHRCRPVSQRYDDSGFYKYGLKYAGYVIVIRDEKGAILRSRATKSSWLKNLEKLDRMQPGKHVDF